MQGKPTFLTLLSSALLLTSISCTQSSNDIGFKSGASLPQPVILKKAENSAIPTPENTFEPVPHAAVPPQALPEPSAIIPAIPTPAVVDPAIPQPATPVEPVAIAENGEVAFGVYGILNMATNYQITNDGYRIQVRDTNGEVLTTGDLDVSAIIDGEPIDFDANNDVLARPMLLRVLNPQYISPSMATKSGTQSAVVSICMPTDINQAYNTKLICRDLNSEIGHANGINTIDSVNAQVDFQANNQVLVKSFSNLPRRAEDSCGTKNGLPCVALGHPALAGYAVSAGQAGNDINSPLVVDLNNDGEANLINVWNDNFKVKFDLLADGNKLRTGWVLPQDGLLVYDANKNGKIDNGNELFGQQSKALFKKANEFENGYLALSQHDHNQDNVIDAKDKIFKRIRVWRDMNSDGISQKNELRSLAYYKIASLKTGSKKVSLDKVNVEGNRVYLESTLATTSKSNMKTFDVWFAVRPYENALLSQSK